MMRTFHRVSISQRVKPPIIATHNVNTKNITTPPTPLLDSSWENLALAIVTDRKEENITRTEVKNCIRRRTQPVAHEATIKLKKETMDNIPLMIVWVFCDMMTMLSRILDKLYETRPLPDRFIHEPIKDNEEAFTVVGRCVMISPKGLLVDLLYLDCFVNLIKLRLD